MKEIWKDIPNYEGYYQASNLGRIKSLWYGKEKVQADMFGGMTMSNDLWIQITNLTNDLNNGLKDLRARGVAYAEAYRKYRMLLSQELLKLKNEGMPATIAYDIARGKEEIANAKFEELKTEAYYRSCLEGINVYKMQIKILENQLNREYNTNIS